MPLTAAAYAAPNKGTPIFFTDLVSSTVVNLKENSKIVGGLFKALELFSSTFQGKFNFQGLFKKALYIQVLFLCEPCRMTLKSHLIVYS